MWLVILGEPGYGHLVPWEKISNRRARYSVNGSKEAEEGNTVI